MIFFVDAQLPLRLARVLQSAVAILFIIRIYLDEMQLRIQKNTGFPSKKAELLLPKIEILAIHL